MKYIWEVKHMKGKLIFVGLIFVLIGITLGGCNGGVSSPAGEQEEEEEKGEEEEQDVILTERKIRPVEIHFRADGSELTQELYGAVTDTNNFPEPHPAMKAYEVLGYLQNVTDDTIQHVQLEAKYYDDDGNLLLTQTEEFYDLAAQSQQRYLFRFENSEYFKIVSRVALKVYIILE